MGWFYTCQHSAVMGGKMTAIKSLSSAFLKEEGGVSQDFKVLTWSIISAMMR
jgi:hypothetical protein